METLVIMYGLDLLILLLALVDRRNHGFLP